MTFTPFGYLNEIVTVESTITKTLLFAETKKQLYFTCRNNTFRPFSCDIPSNIGQSQPNRNLPIKNIQFGLAQNFPSCSG